MTLKRTCTKCFRDFIANKYPGLKDNPGHWRHMSRLLFAKDYAGVIIGQWQVAVDYYKLSNLMANRFSAIDYIKVFQEEVLSYTIKEYSYVDNLCREASVEFPSDILEAVSLELSTYNRKDKRVYLATGEVITKNNKNKLREEDKQQAMLISKSIKMHPLQSKLQNYLNDLNGNRFERITSYIPEALKALYDKNDKGEFIITPLAIQEQTRILLSIAEQPQPYYVPSANGKTIRLFELNSGLQGVHSYLRKILTKDWVEVDLQNAHLAIVTRLWDIPSIKTFLETGKSIWEDLLPHLGFDITNKDMKAVFKEYLYGCVYGMSKSRLELEITTLYGEDIYSRFLSHPVISALLEARNKRIEYLASKRKYTTALGEVIKIESFKDASGNFISNIPSILSQEANEFEMVLLEPIFTYCVDTDGIDIMLYQFDGVSLCVSDKRRKDLHLKRLQSLINQRAEDLGILTKLVI
jgi:chaperonin cofactor prefoldin